MYKDFQKWVPIEIQRILNRLIKDGDIWIVGGSVLNFLQGTTCTEIDAIWTQDIAFLQYQGGIPIGGDHQTHAWRFDSSLLEISPMRGTTLEEDLFSRDFSIHAMAIQWNSGRFRDPSKGKTALEEQLLIVPDINKSPFSEDPVRILRGFRRVAEGFSWEKQTKQLGQKAITLLSETTPDRIGAEIQKIMAGPAPGEAIQQIYEWDGLLDQILFNTFDLNHQEQLKDNFLKLSALPAAVETRIAGLLYLLISVTGIKKFQSLTKHQLQPIESLLQVWALPKQIQQNTKKILYGHICAQTNLSSAADLRVWYSLYYDYVEQILALEESGFSGSSTGLATWRESLEPLKDEKFPQRPSELNFDPESFFETHTVPKILRAKLLEELWYWTLEDPSEKNQTERLTAKAIKILATLS